MKFNWKELFSDLFGKELTEEEKDELEDAMGDAVSSMSFEDVASSVKEDYPNATEEDLRRAITMKGMVMKLATTSSPHSLSKKNWKNGRRLGLRESRF